jgi:hypothetical protein
MMKRFVAALFVSSSIACCARQETVSAPLAPPPPPPAIEAHDVPAGRPRAPSEGPEPGEVHDADAYAVQLATFFHSRWSYPKTVTPDEAAQLCVVFQINVSPRMLIWHIRSQPVVSSGNEAFDDSARVMLFKLLDDRTALPDPPPSAADLYRGRTLQIALAGELRGDTSPCRPPPPP